MTNLITEARELCDMASDTKWEAWMLTSELVNLHDARFFARSRTLIPELCDALEKAEADLMRYRGAERDGRCVVLPCKVGDTVYNLTSDSPSGIEETKVFQIRLTKNSYRALCNCVYDDWGSARWEFGPNDFGKTVFLTREAAEALKGGTP